VRLGIGSDSRIGYSFIYPGCGYGGSCFPKDVKALIHMAEQARLEPMILGSVHRRNERQKQVLFAKIAARFGADLSGLTFGLWGLAFKPGTDDMREAPAVVLLHQLVAAGARILAYDPEAMEVARAELPRAWFESDTLRLVRHQYEALEGVDALALVTEWKPFRHPDWSAMKKMMKQAVVFDGRNQYDPKIVTGAAGFIGFHLTKRLLDRGDEVVGLDNLNDYYDVSLKQARLAQLEGRPGFRFVKLELADRPGIAGLFAGERFDKVVNLAAQAGVRYSLQNPHAYVDSNLVGFVNILEGCRHSGVEHLVFASSSSVYGANTAMPFSVHHNVDHPVSLYAATKKANELMAHTYSHLLRPADHRPALLHRLRPLGPAGHGAVPLHQSDPRGEADRRLQLRQDAAGLHLHRRHRRRGDPGDGPDRDAQPRLDRRCTRPRHQRRPLPQLQHRQQQPGGAALPHRNPGKGPRQTAEKNLLPIQPGDVPPPTPTSTTWSATSASSRRRPSRKG
jgi:NAD(P)-dependent dehydrogenase (short-subunit alcohol dehydrogenase family)